MADDSDKTTVAEQVWRSMFGFIMHTRPRRDAVLTGLGLTPTEAKALDSLDGETGRTMKELAAEWSCDASTATWTVDRLERLHMAERRPRPGDRRVRLVVLTPLGVTTKEEMTRGMHMTPPELLDLGEEELRALRALLTKLPGGTRSPA
ncbi:MarR family winged helix-turn-helix transcriptional regulator [Streptosporangium sp. NPDC001559]|uniref:MarR family winged helix-turn-helix transcriptional regulator n=1 Tax=unclassified Streptosporangium TaxID=2632669 RepID=UPI00343F6F38